MRAVARSTAAPPSERASSSTSLPPRSCERATQVATCSSPIPSQLGELDLEADQVVGGEAAEDRVARLALDAELGQQLAVEVGVAEADHRAVEPGGVERRLEHLDHLGGPLRRRRADQLDPGLGELAHLAALRAHGAEGVCQVTEPQRRLGARRSGWRPGGRSAPSCRSAARAGRRARRRSGRRCRRCGRRRGRAPRRTRSPASRPRRSRGFEDLDHRQVQAPQLPHLVGQHVARSRWNRMNHPPDLTRVGAKALLRRDL